MAGVQSTEQWQTQIKSLKDGIARIYKTKEFSDVILTVSGRKFEAHRLILGARSPVLAKLLLKTNSDSSLEGNITIDGVSEDGFEKLLHYIYTAELLKGDNEEDIMETYRAAVMFEQTGLLNQCTAILEKIKITADNVCRFLKDASDIDILKTRCHDFVKTNVLSVLISERFLDLLDENLRELFAKGYFKNVPTMMLLVNVLRWGKNQFVPQDDFKLVRSLLLETDEPLLGKVGIEKLSSAELADVVANYKELLTMEESMMFFVHAHKKGTAPLPNWCSSEQ